VRLVVRPVRAEERGAVGRLVVEAYRALPGGRLSDDYASFLVDTGWREAEGGQVLVAERGGRVVGTVTYVDGPGPLAEFDDPYTAGIRALAVAPDAQGSGVGGRLVRACLDLAWHAGRARVSLYTTPWMQNAARIYDRLGFVRAPSLDHEASAEVQLLAYVLDLDAVRAAADRPRTSSGSQAMGRAMLGLGELFEGTPPRQFQEWVWEDPGGADPGLRLDFDPRSPSASEIVVPDDDPADPHP
jgi:GNAT superfamily N-acetyltransferase